MATVGGAIAIAKQVVDVLKTAKEWLPKGRVPAKFDLAPHIPKQTIRIFEQQIPNAACWNPSTVDQRPAMQITGWFVVTNTTRINIIPIRTRLRTRRRRDFPWW